MDSQPNRHEEKKDSGFKGYASRRFAVAAVLIVLVAWAFNSLPEYLMPGGQGVDRGAETVAETQRNAGDLQTADQMQSGPDTNPQNEEPKPSPVDQMTQHPAPAVGAPPGETDAHSPDVTAGDGETSEEDASQPHEVMPAEKDLHEEIDAHPSVVTAGTGGTSGEGASQPPEVMPAEKNLHEAESMGDQEVIVSAKTAAEDHASPSNSEPVVTKESQSPDSPQEQHEQPAPKAAAPAPAHVELPTGVAFVDAVMEPLEYELNQRFWGWRPNDIINLTDNVNNYQLGVLEVTRRTVVQLAERISRTGSTDAFNPNLENAMNWLMVKGTRYWFPAPETKYKESLDELKIYREELVKGQASFYTRTDNLIPLLAAFEDLLGSCDENLVKQENEDGSEVSLFQADDYFFYAKGIAGAMAVILEAIHHDFRVTLEGRNGSELLHHALESCKMAASIDPLLIFDADLDGSFANHRANMAAPISHARFYLGQLIKTLST